MTFVALALIVLALPAFALMLRQRWGTAAASFLLGFLPFIITAANLDAAVINWAMWPGYAKGLVVTALDSLALAVLLTFRRPVGRPPFKAVFLLYIAAVAAAVIWSRSPVSSTFYVGQLLRVFVVLLAAARVSQRPGALRWLPLGLAAGAAIQALVSIDQRLSGTFQAAGTMGHQNLLGMMMHFVTLPLLAILLAGSRSKWLIAGLAAALVTIALGASRGTIGFAAAGIGVLLLTSFARRSTPHKLRILGISALALAVAAPFALSGIEKRLADLQESGSYDERAAFARAAGAMWAENPLGVGPNQYVVVANTEGYSQRAGVVWNWGSRAAHVHNVYLLAAAETGWLGLAALIALFAWPILRGLHFAFADRSDSAGEVVLGITVALLVTAGHSLYEWIFVTFQVQYIFAVSLGTAAGLIAARQPARAGRRSALRPAGQGEGGGRPATARAAGEPRAGAPRSGWGGRPAHRVRNDPGGPAEA